MPVDPAKLSIRTYPDPVLRAVAKPVPEINDEVRQVAKRMLAVMREERGIGLAAPQIGLSWRMFIADVPERESRDDDEPAPAPDALPSFTDGPVVYINPKLTAISPPLPVEAGEEGCLSLPDIRGQVQRPPAITITYTDLEGVQHTQSAQGLLARCWQHEFDHLDGVLIIDKFTQISRLKNRLKIKQLERQG